MVAVLKGGPTGRHAKGVSAIRKGAVEQKSHEAESLGVPRSLLLKRAVAFERMRAEELAVYGARFHRGVLLDLAKLLDAGKLAEATDLVSKRIVAAAAAMRESAPGLARAHTAFVEADDAVYARGGTVLASLELGADPYAGQHHYRERIEDVQTSLKAIRDLSIEGLAPATPSRSPAMPAPIPPAPSPKPCPALADAQQARLVAFQRVKALADEEAFLDDEVQAAEHVLEVPNHPRAPVYQARLDEIATRQRELYLLLRAALLDFHAANLDAVAAGALSASYFEKEVREAHDTLAEQMATDPLSGEGFTYEDCIVLQGENVLHALAERCAEVA